MFYKGWGYCFLGRMVREGFFKEIKVDLRFKNVKVVVMRVFREKMILGRRNRNFKGFERKYI